MSHLSRPHKVYRPRSLVPPFSSYRHVDVFYGGRESVRRLFSQSRMLGGRTLVTEEVPPQGLVTDENKQLHALYPKHHQAGLQRLSFWSQEFSAVREIKHLTSRDLVGYAILKHDVVGTGQDNWHVFESVFRKIPFKHLFVPNTPSRKIRVANSFFSIEGVMYCQQNGLNKMCAQVALRTLLSRLLPQGDIGYSKIHELARGDGEDFPPGRGLSPKDIRNVLEGLNISYDDIDYDEAKRGSRKRMPYQKYLYAGIECGAGALLGFKLSGSGTGRKHVIPCFGHTFNKDAWVPSSDNEYFAVGKRTKYIPSALWTASFVAHDDNFGANFCIPRLYVDRQHVQYVAALNPPKASGMLLAEATAAHELYEIADLLSSQEAPKRPTPNQLWLKRLIHFCDEQKIIVRTVAVTKQQYVRHLASISDWEKHKEEKSIPRFLDYILPPLLWMTEISIPDLFPCNYRKVGEIILDASLTDDNDEEAFKLARIPGSYLFSPVAIPKEFRPPGAAKYIRHPSNLGTHTPILTDAARPHHALPAQTPSAVP